MVMKAKDAMGGTIHNVPYALSGGFPDSSRVRLVYTEYVDMASVASATQVWTGNGPFDPNVTGTGSQPVQYDDWSLIYNRVRPMGSTIEASFITSGSGTSTRFILAPRHTATSVVSSVGAMDGACSNAYSKHVLLSTIPTAATMTHHMTTAKFMGQPVKGSDLLQSLTSSNPSHLWYWHTSMITVDGTTANSRGGVLVTLTYDLEFFDRLETGIDAMAKRVEEIKAAKALRVSGKQDSARERKDSQDSEPSSPWEALSRSQGGSVEQPKGSDNLRGPTGSLMLPGPSKQKPEESKSRKDWRQVTKA
jgi:hypothetical protein